MTYREDPPPLIGARVSPDEYRRLKQLASENGFPSLSGLILYALRAYCGLNWPKGDAVRQPDEELRPRANVACARVTHLEKARLLWEARKRGFRVSPMSRLIRASLDAMLGTSLGKVKKRRQKVG
jgi:hypothetical protein